MDDDLGALVIFITAVTMLVLGVAFGVDVMKDKAIDHGAAYYHPETAKFTWYDNKETTK